jgi:CubicO group peptidase (beta-lactamase class C family)
VHDTFRTSLDAIAEAIVRRGAAPVAACAFAVRRASGWCEAASSEGALLFDLASVTKPFTAVALAEEPDFLDRRIGDALPLVAAEPGADRPLFRILGHRAGFDAHVPLFLPALEGAPVDAGRALQHAARCLHAEARPADEDSPAVYSDLGYMLAGAALARRDGAPHAGAALEAGLLARLNVLDAIGTAEGLRARHADAEARFVPTEHAPWRGGVARGAVHDDNAWVLTGHGASGHAGLFGTAAGVLAFGRAILEAWVRDEGPLAHVPFARLLAEQPGTTWRMGFDGKAKEGPSTAGASASARSVGHLGFTGTSVWLDPDREAVTVLLTNRVHPARAFNALRELRGAAHDALFGLADRA